MTLRITLINLLSVALLAASCTSEGDGDTTTEDAAADGAAPEDDAGELDDGGSEAGGDEPDASEMDASLSDGATDDADAIDDASPPDASDEADGGDASNSGSDAGGSTGVPCGVLGDLSASSGRIWDLGHGTFISALTRAGDRLLSVDHSRYWVLWDLSTHTIVARGQIPPMNDNHSLSSEYVPMPVLAGGHLAVVTSPTSVEVRRATDGAVLSTIAASLPFNINYQISRGRNDPFGMASDGSYIWVASNTGITAWNLSGAVVGSNAGDYHQAQVVALPNELRIAYGAAGANAIEKVSVTGGSTTSASFLGTFSNWSTDGERFFTLTANTLRLYRGDTVQQLAILALPQTSTFERPYDSQGPWFWVSTPSLSVYLIADTSAPIGTYSVTPPIFFVEDTLRTVSPPELKTIHLTAPNAPMTSEALPYFSAVSRSLTTMDAHGDWAMGGPTGVIFEGSDLAHPLSCGKALDIAGADNGRVAIATAGGITLFELSSSARELSGNISLESPAVEISRNGSVLAANHTGGALKVYSLPSRNQLREWPSTDGRSLNAVSDDGARLAATTGVDPQTGFRWSEILDIATGTPTLRVSNAGSFAGMSPSGNRIAFSPPSSVLHTQTTNFYQGTGTLIGATQGIGLAWMDEDRVLVAHYAMAHLGSAFSNIEIVDSTGAPVLTTTLPWLRVVQPLPGDRLYSRDAGNDNLPISGVYAAMGPVIWSGPKVVAGSVAGPFVVHTPAAAPHEVVIVPY